MPEKNTVLYQIEIPVTIPIMVGANVPVGELINRVKFGLENMLFGVQITVADTIPFGIFRESDGHYIKQTRIEEEEGVGGSQ